MTVCPKCNGKGYYFVSEAWGEADIVCERCKGKGEVDKNGKPIFTNEEYLKSLNAEQLAEFIIKAMLFYDNAGITMLEAIKKAVEDNEKLGSYFMESVLEWLKQPHNAKE